MLKWEPLKEGNIKSSLKCDCCFAQISLTKVNPDFQLKIHHRFSNFFCRDGNGAKGRVFALTGKEYFSRLDFDIATALHPPKDEVLFERSYANRNVHIPYLAALNLFLTLINCSTDYKGTINMWGHAEEEIMLGFYEAAKFLQCFQSWTSSRDRRLCRRAFAAISCLPSGWEGIFPVDF